MRICLSLVIFISLAGMIGCGGAPEAATHSNGVPDPSSVTVIAPHRKAIHYQVEQPGRVEPFETTPIFAKVAGYVRTVHVEIGDRVKRGSLLAELDVPELVEEGRRKVALVEQARLGVTQAEQEEDVAEASLSFAKAQTEVARAALRKAVAARDRWESESQRMEKLVQQKIIDPQSRDEVMNQFHAADAAKAEAEARIRAADAAFAEARAHRAKAHTDVYAAGNHLVVVEAEEREVQARIGYLRITAPFDGVVAERRVHTGHFLQAATGGAKGEPLFVVVRTDKVRVFVEVPEADAIQVNLKSVGHVRVQALNDREFVGHVRGSSWSLDPSQRTLCTEIDFDNADQLLRPGMYVHARIDVDRPDAWVIPTAAVLVRDGLTFCYQVHDGKTHRLALRTGLRDGAEIEVLKMQAPSARAGELPRWINPTGAESIVAARPGEMMDNQPVQVLAPNVEGVQ